MPNSCGALAAATLLWLCVNQALAGPYLLPPLPYNYSALEPAIDTQTMRFHHDIHHSTYVNNTNAAVATNDALAGLTISQLLLSLNNNSYPEALQTKLRNNAGGHWNHAFWWKILAPANSSDTSEASISPELLSAINKEFGGVSQMKTALSTAAKDHFGSGWGWLVLTPEGSLKVIDTLNQDNPLTKFVASSPLIPILGIDVWEHGYYLKYGPSKAKYVDAVLGIFNYTQASQNYEAAKRGDLSTIAVAY